jgi:predicted phosphodiesterase
MQIGLISDMHGNLPALEAVLADMTDIDTIGCVGDVVGYNPWPAACVDRVREIASVTVQGNHDRTVRTPEKYRANWMARAGIEYALDELSESQLSWLDNLPSKATIDDGRFLVVHDHPQFQDRYVMPKDFDGLWSYLDEYTGLAIGHTYTAQSAGWGPVNCESR